MSPGKEASNRNLSRLLRQREQDSYTATQFKEQLYVTPEFVHRLRLWDQLSGHNGCVNCLQWNESGTILASGSDDYQVILWDAFNRRKLHAIQTGHLNNIFSVQFVPESADRLLVSGAGDGKVRVHDVNSSTGESVQVFNCHFSRVKRLAVCPLEPNLVWSASEDGTVMQFDLRTPPSCRDECTHVLINLNAHIGPEAEVKCISINPRRPEYLAVGANDPFVRVYDRRHLSPKKIRLATTDHNGAVWNRQAVLNLALENENYDFNNSAVRYYVAGHLPYKYREMKRRFRALATTFLTFSPCGNDLLVNLGGEQIYLFDLNGRRRSLLTDLPSYFPMFNNTSGPETSNGISQSNGFMQATNGCSKSFKLNATLSQSGRNSDSKFRTSITPRAELLKQRANSLFEKHNYIAATMLYSQAIAAAPKSAVMYANRAAAYMKRNWDGDVYAALRDCYMTLQLDPDHLKAHFRLARCLHLLGCHAEARQCLDIFKAKFSDRSKIPACIELDQQIDYCLNGKEDAAQPKRKRSRSGSSLSDIDANELGSSRSNDATQTRADEISEQEMMFRDSAVDYDRRFCGHCNTTTDIKEANFFGQNGEYIVAGSDDGKFFIWDRQTCSLVRILHGDESIVNCLQPHPTQCLLATSGIEATVKLWMPMPEDGTNDPRVVLDADFDTAAVQNQKRMNADPLEVMLMNMGYRILRTDAANDNQESNAAIQCNPS